MQDYRDIKVWQKAHQLTLDVYAATAGFPPEERFGLTSQMRRAAVSIAANIVEGRARQADGDFGRFLSIALGSASELEYLLLLARDLNYTETEQYGPMADEIDQVKRMLATFVRRLAAERSTKTLKAES